MKTVRSKKKHPWRRTNICARKPVSILIHRGYIYENITRPPQKRIFNPKEAISS